MVALTKSQVYAPGKGHVITEFHFQNPCFFDFNSTNFICNILELLQVVGDGMKVYCPSDSRDVASHDKYP